MSKPVTKTVRYVQLSTYVRADRYEKLKERARAETARTGKTVHQRQVVEAALDAYLKGTGDGAGGGSSP